MRFVIDSKTIANDWGNYKNDVWNQVQYYIGRSMMGSYPHELEERVFKDVRNMKLTDINTIANTVKHHSRMVIEKYVKHATNLESINCGSNMLKGFTYRTMIENNQYIENVCNRVFTLATQLPL